MKLFRKRRPGEGSTGREDGIRSGSRFRGSMQGRERSDFLIIGAMALVLAIAAWLTIHTLNRPAPNAGGLPDAEPTLPSPMLGLPPADEVLTGPIDLASGLASEAAVLPSEGAQSLLPPLPPPPPKQAVLPVDGDAVFAPAAPEPVATQPARKKPGPVLIFDSGTGNPGNGDGAGGPDVSTAAPRSPAAAGSVPGVATLPTGTLIPAVLETVIDPSQPGGVRAMVSSDVRSADGRRLLVPRSSRLVGQYRSDDSKSRAYVIWTRLDRPDGTRVPLGQVTGDKSRFVAQYNESALVSQVGGDARGGVRVRQGEAIRVVAARAIELQAGRR